MSDSPPLDESPRPGTRTLYRGGQVYGATDPFATAMVIADQEIAWIGSDEAAAGHADEVDAVVELDGALVTPTFVDAHVHTSATGLGLRSVDLTTARSLQQALAKIEDAARRRQGRPVYAPNWDEQDWPERRPPTAKELDRASYGGVVYSPRVDGHSAVISSALAAASGAGNQVGWNDGLVTSEAHHAARDAFYSTIGAADRRADIDSALKAAAAAGIGLVHENGGPVVSSAADFADVLAAGRHGNGTGGTGGTGGAEVIGYWGELVSDEESARTLADLMGARGLAGDINIDGSIGSRTASLRQPYASSPGGAGVGDRAGVASPGGSQDLPQSGNAYLCVEQVRDHVAACSRAGIQAGFHVIGDAGADTAIAGFQAAAGQVGAATVIAARHRLEHLEMVDAEGIKALVELGVTASVQPAFDANWGGPQGMYAARLGRERAGTMNLFATMTTAGLSIALGSDTPVTPFAPWEAIRACIHHHDPAQRICADAAFLAHTRGGWRAAGIDDLGHLGLGQPASFVVWFVGSDPGSGTPIRAGLPDLSPGATLPITLRTVIRGRTVFDREGAL